MEYVDRLKELLPGFPPEVIDFGGRLEAESTSFSAVESFADAYRTMVTTGAKPLFADHSSQGFSNAEIADAARLLGIPVTSSNGTTDADSVKVHGELNEPERHTYMALSADGDLIYLLGPLPQDSRQDYQPNFEHERLIGDIMIAASRDGLLNAAHAVTEAGFLVALSQMALLGEKGARFWIPDGVPTEDFLFSSAPGRIICVVPRSEEIRFSDMCIARYVPLHRVGVVDGDQLELQDHFVVPVSELA